jgi:Flp pilus assembly protein TadD
MNYGTIAKLAASSLAIGMVMTGCGPVSQQARPVSASDQAVVAKQAAKFADQAIAILVDAKGKKAKAVDFAERAVGLAPTNASYRMTLGRAYLANGRFTAAETSFADALALEPSDAKAALNLALMKIARGDSATALGLLEAHRDAMPTADYGLALALAGDLAGGIQTLQAAARAPEATAQTRQNLGLAYAFAGRWVEARALASQDLSLALVGDRLSQWAVLARPNAAWDQVAGLFGVTPVVDAGQPQRLALITPENRAVAANEAVKAPDVGVVPEVDAVAMAETPAPAFETSVPARETAAVPAPAKIVSMALDDPAPYVAKKPIAQSPKPAASAPLIKASSTPVKQAIVPASGAFSENGPSRAIESGQFAVQLGAFSRAENAEMAWSNAVQRVAELDNYAASTSHLKTKSGSLVRLAATGFQTYEAASQVCNEVRRSGGQCFVRSAAGGAPIQYVKRSGGAKIAARR